MAYEGINKSQVNKLKNKLSKVKVKSGFVGEKLLKDIVDEAFTGSGNEHKLDDAWNGSQSLSDRQLLAEIYLLSRDDYYNNLKESFNIWKSVFTDLGYTDYDNPFMYFLENFKYTKPLDSVCCRNLVNSYASGVVSSEDLKNPETFVYNPYLYEKGVDTAAYLNLYKHLTGSTLDGIAANMNSALSRTDITPEMAKNSILFGTFDANENTNPLAPMNSVKKLLDKYGKGTEVVDRSKVSKVDDSDGDEDAVSKFVKAFDKLSDTDKAALFAELKTKLGS